MRAVFFDLDGTLVDSEPQTDESIRVVMARHGIADFALPHGDTRGRTWAHVAETIRVRTGLALAADALAAELLEHWSEASVHVTPVPGAPEALRAAAASGLLLGVVSSSPRSVIDSFVGKLGVDDCIDRRARIGGDAVRNGKPDPEGFLLAARAVGVDPADALVFEDSEAGLRAARAAGMRSMFVTCCASDLPAKIPLATASCRDYHALPPRFWEQLASDGSGFAGRSFT